MNEERKKFCEAEVILGVFYFGGVDGVAILLDLTVVGAVIAPFIQALFGTLVMLLWFFLGKQDAGVLQLGRASLKFAANAIPIVPTNLIIFCVSAYLHNHPKAARVAQKFTKLTKKGAGGLAGAVPGTKNG